MSDIQKIKEDVALGEETKQFLLSPLGRKIQTRAQYEADAAKNALVNVSPNNIARIIELQNIVVRFESFESWLNEIITVGDTAYDEYQLWQAED